MTATVRVMLRITGRNERIVCPTRGDGPRHAARSGAARMVTSPMASRRWVGLKRASIPCSIPKKRCQAMSPMPPAPKRMTPATPHP